MTGERQAERYEREREIGRGGMGRVFRARDTHLGRHVALKMLPAEVTHDEELRRRLAREARAASALTHPGVATVYDFVELAGESFIVFEYVEGATLREHLHRQRFTIEETLDIGVQLADALAAAHDRGIVHRDLKPENIMLTPEPERSGRVKILDFGLAKFRRPVAQAALAGSGEETGTITTTTGLLVGTVNYMSPEQLEGEPVDARSDLYTLGLVLYELTAGVNPFLGRTHTSTIARILKDDPPPLQQRNPIAPAELDRILRKCLRKHPQERYQTARELFVDLNNLRRDLASPGGQPHPAITQAAPAPPLTISRAPARVLLAFIQVGYLVMYGVAFYKFADFVARLQTGPARSLRYFLLLSAICGPAVRLYLLTALAFDYADLGRKFRWLFPALLAIDLAWAAAPLVLLPELGGFLIAATAALAFLPFSQRTLVYAAYASSGGRISSVQPRDSF